MKLTCTCGHEFEVPEGAEEAECPECGRRVSAETGDEWLGSLGVEDLELSEEKGAGGAAEAERPPVTEVPAEEEAEPEQEPPAPGAGQKPESERAPGGDEEEEKGGGLEVEGPSGGERAPARARHATGASGVRGGPAAAEEEPAAGVRQLMRMGTVGPARAVEGFKRRPGTTEMVVVAAAFALMGFFLAGAAAYFAQGGFGLGALYRNIAHVVVELGAAAVIVLLGMFLLKRGSLERPDTVGTMEAVIVSRLLALALIVPLGVILGLIVAAGGGAGEASGTLVWCGRHLLWGYAALVFLAQAALVVPVLGLGCLPGVVANVIVVGGAASLAARVAEIFA